MLPCASDPYVRGETAASLADDGRDELHERESDAVGHRIDSQWPRKLSVARAFQRKIERQLEVERQDGFVQLPQAPLPSQNPVGVAGRGLHESDLKCPHPSVVQLQGRPPHGIPSGAREFDGPPDRAVDVVNIQLRQGPNVALRKIEQANAEIARRSAAGDRSIQLHLRATVFALEHDAVEAIARFAQIHRGSRL